LPSVALGKEGSARSASVKPSLLSTFSRALGKEVCRVPDSTRQRKVAVTASGDGDDVFAECPGWHSAKELPLPSVVGQTLGKEAIFVECHWDTRQRIRQRGSPCQVLCRVSPVALGKACFFAECQGHYTRQRTYIGAQVLVLCRVLWSGHSAKYLFAECYTRQSDQ
jgi:hypothetical protein